MKKLLVLLLSLVLLPCAALAQTEADAHTGTDLSTLNADGVVALPSGDPVSDYPSMTIDEAMPAIGEDVQNYFWSLSGYQDGGDVVMIDVHYTRPAQYVDGQAALADALLYTIDFQQAAFTVPGVSQLYFRFYGPVAAGDETSMLITLRVKKATSARIDLDQHRRDCSVRQLAYLKAVDGYSVVGDWQRYAR